MSRAALADLPAKFDLIIIGGGITGAGILREAVRTKARVLLLEQSDFASGTSSASSKLVHGGLRYLKTGEWRLTLESVRERQRLLDEAPGLVEAQPFLMPIYRGVKPGRAAMRVGLWLYDRMAGRSNSQWLDAKTTLKLEPHIRQDGLLGAMQYEDARTDDARLVLRLIFESLSEGASARNYTRVVELSRAGNRVAGVAVRDELSGETREIQAGMVVNATGAWADRVPGAPQLRPLRGSHFVFPLSKLPIGRAVSWMHPKDHRPIFAYPWEGAALYGTTDLDHGEAELHEPRMSGAEADYLLEGLAHQFPALKLNAGDAISSYAGVRPVVSGGQADPSAESRESALWSSDGLVGITGGKLTTFRVTARQVLREAAKQAPVLAPAEERAIFEPGSGQRIDGRLGAAAGSFTAGTAHAEQDPVPGTPYSLAELRWAARLEQVVHLDDLLLRRTRLGLVMKDGGSALFRALKAICTAELGWDEAHWNSEQQRYQQLWQRRHAPNPV